MRDSSLPKPEERSSAGAVRSKVLGLWRQSDMIGEGKSQVEVGPDSEGFPDNHSAFTCGLCGASIRPTTTRLLCAWKLARPHFGPARRGDHRDRQPEIRRRA